MTTQAAVMYLRKSRADEADPEFTLEKHRRALLDYARKNKIAVTNVYEEVVSGATLAQRPQMLQLLEDVQKGGVPAVLCMDMDRLGRGDMQDVGKMLEILKLYRVCIVTPHKTIDLNNPADEDYAEFKAFFARFELNTIKRRMQEGKKRAAQDGYHVSAVPFGYERTYIDNGKPTLKPHPEFSQYIKMIFHWYVYDGLGTPAIAEKLNAMGVRTSSGALFRRNAITVILKNPIYIGKIVYNTEQCIRKSAKGTKSKCIARPEKEWIVAPGKHPPLVDEETFQKAQSILKDKTHPPFNTGEVKNPLAGLVRCSVCGEMMQRRPYYKRGLDPQILCPTKGCCRGVLQSKLEDAVLSHLMLAANSIRFYYQQETKQKKERPKTDFSVLQANLKKLTEQKDKAYDLLEQGVYTTAVFTERQKNIQNRIDAITAEIEKKKKEELLYHQALQSKKELLPKLEKLINGYRTMDIPTKNAQLKEILSHIDYRREKGEWQNPFDIKLNFK